MVNHEHTGVQVLGELKTALVQVTGVQWYPVTLYRHSPPSGTVPTTPSAPTRAW